MDFSKYQTLVAALKPGGKLNWEPNNTADRVVLFTERIETLQFLREHLQNDLRLKNSQSQCSTARIKTISIFRKRWRNLAPSLLPSAC